MTAITTLQELRSEFWAQHPRLDKQARINFTRNKPQNEQPVAIRCTFVDWIDHMHRSGQISDALADSATL